MSVALPDQLDPWRAVRSGVSFAGSIPLAELPRLSAAVLPDVGAEPSEVSFQLSFARDPDRGAVVTGWARAGVRLRCERCLGEMTLPVDARLALALLATEAGASELTDDLDPLILGEGTLRPRDLIEDELLLAIPVVPRHPEGECAAPLGPGDAESALEAMPVGRDEPPARRKPFAALADLKSEGRA
jgi:uncharacterized protein